MKLMNEIEVSFFIQSLLSLFFIGNKKLIENKRATLHVHKQYTREAIKIIAIYINIKTPPESKMSDYLK